MLYYQQISNNEEGKFCSIINKSVIMIKWGDNLYITTFWRGNIPPATRLDDFPLSMYKSLFKSNNKSLFIFYFTDNNNNMSSTSVYYKVSLSATPPLLDSSGSRDQKWWLDYYCWRYNKPTVWIRRKSCWKYLIRPRRQQQHDRSNFLQ